MEIGIVDGKRTVASKGLMGQCPGCGAAIIAKAGNINIPHWAHVSSKDCDNWWEPETQWHRDWKSRFPEDWREKIMKDAKQHHRADVHTPSGVTIEFQNSTISTDGIISREGFYNKLIWVINGTDFKNNFHFYGPGPDPKSALLAGYDIVSQYSFKLMLKEDLVPGSKTIPVMAMIYTSDDIAGLIDSHDCFSFTWTRERKSWRSAQSPVFFDFGGEELYFLKTRQQIGSNYTYLKKISKKRFITKYTRANGSV